MLKLPALLTDESGAALAEYSLILTLLAVAVIAAVAGAGTSISSLFVHAAAKLQGR
ncbi:MAG: Flp family type IVb pilin [Candidatus Eremiobacteraeota bacterium]|nr:Flp family type IVb pilin [Candidatus Eremiobacteraeota bacterium]